MKLGIKGDLGVPASLPGREGGGDSARSIFLKGLSKLKFFLEGDPASLCVQEGLVGLACMIIADGQREATQ